MPEIDVSLELSSMCVVDATGRILKEAKISSEPATLVAFFGTSRATLDSIGSAPGTGKFVRSGPGPDHRFTYSIILNIGPLRLTVVAARLTDPNNLRTELSVSVS
jgi:hypothetical protein